MHYDPGPQCRQMIFTGRQLASGSKQQHKASKRSSYQVEFAEKE